MLENIKNISYNFEKEVITIELKTKILHKGFMVDKLNFKASYEVFLEKTNKWLEFNNSNKD